MKKNILFGAEARRALMRGVDRLAEVVKVTLAPWGGMWCWIGTSAPRW